MLLRIRYQSVKYFPPGFPLFMYRVLSVLGNLSVYRRYRAFELWRGSFRVLVHVGFIEMSVLDPPHLWRWMSDCELPSCAPKLCCAVLCGYQ